MFTFFAGDECEKYFSSKHNMERHQKKIHNMPGAGAASGSQLVKEESGWAKVKLSGNPVV